MGPEIGSADATDLLNDYFAALKAKGLKYAYFDKPHTYHVSGKLTEARDLILLGNNAWIKSSLLDNYWIQIINNRQHYNGKYNVAPSGVDLSTALSALRINKTCRVTIWGDSISTSGTDFINVSYNSHGSTNKWSPNGITSSDSLFYRLVDVLTTEFKDVAFNFYNRANAGTTLSQWQEDKTFNGVTKPWIEH
ncbi:hypothetical protein RW092_06020, partial [Paenibacillus sp. 3LSP]|uniref:hypothetical protein n=1 Tax=Paenibacillus sp. 3LSP TaxID=2800795 RepID=UPI0028FD81D2